MTAITKRYRENNVNKCHTVSTDGRGTNAANGARAPSPVPAETTTEGDAFIYGQLRAMKAVRRVVTTDITIEHHAFRLGHQHTTAMALDHLFGKAGAVSGYVRVMLGGFG